MLLAATLAAQAPSPSPSQPERDRVALVIGNATYRVDPLDNPVNDARLVARALAAAQFKVTLHENLNRQAMIEAMRRFGAQLNERSVALVYYAGHGLQLRDRNFLIPTDAEIHSEAEIPLAGVDVSFVLDQMSSARSRVNIVILDACRNNPFAGRAGRSAQGLAQMDAPVGTLLAYATGPGKLAADGLGSNGIYATHLARQIASSVEQVEIMFRRVREGVVRETREQQTPWESSSLQGDFAFHGTQAAGSDPIQVGPLAIARPAEPAVGVPRGAVLPRAGDTFRYRVQDQFRLGDLYVTARVDEVRADAIIESWSASSGARSATRWRSCASRRA